MVVQNQRAQTRPRDARSPAPELESVEALAARVVAQHRSLFAAAWSAAREIAAPKPRPSAWQLVTDELLPKQREFVECDTFEVLFSGAVGCGKSRALCLKVAKRASVPGAFEGLCRLTAKGLKDTTLKTLLERQGSMPPVLTPGSYRWRKQDSIIDLAPSGGGQIYLFGLDGDDSKRGSLQLTGCGIDEASELLESDYTWLADTRVRLEVPGLPRQVYAATNPDGPAHYLARRFGLAAAVEPLPGTRAITTRTRDNHHLPENYVLNLERKTGFWRARYVEGQWVGAEGVIYSMATEANCVERDWAEFSRFIVAVDDGAENPACALLIGIDGDGRAHVFEEFYRGGVLYDAKVAEVERMRDLCEARVNGCSFEAVPVDPSAKGLRNELENVGLPVEAAENDVQGGIQLVAQMIAAGRLTWSKACTNLRRELGEYRRKPGSDQPIKEGDHAMDALRYGVQWVHANSSSGVTVISVPRGRTYSRLRGR